MRAGVSKGAGAGGAGGAGGADETGGGARCSGEGGGVQSSGSRCAIDEVDEVEVASSYSKKQCLLALVPYTLHHQTIRFH